MGGCGVWTVDDCVVTKLLTRWQIGKSIVLAI